MPKVDSIGSIWTAIGSSFIKGFECLHLISLWNVFAVKTSLMHSFCSENVFNAFL